jgi:hypothetical protein
MRGALNNGVRVTACTPRLMGNVGDRMRIPATLVALMCGLLSSGCSTQHFTSVHPAHVVAASIEREWNQICPLVVTEEQTNGYFVGFALGHPVFMLPSGLKHPSYPVWVEVTDTASGSETVYHRAYQVFHGRMDKAVRQCQQTNQ